MHSFIKINNDDTFYKYSTYNNLMNNNSFEQNLNNQDKIITSLEKKDNNLYVKEYKNLLLLFNIIRKNIKLLNTAKRQHNQCTP